MSDSEPIYTIEDPRLKSDAFSFVLPLACTVAYYGDGKLTKEEFDSLLRVADCVVKDDAPDRELAKKEIILDVLDALKEAMEDVEAKDARFEFAVEVAAEFASATKVLVDNQIVSKDNQAKVAWYTSKKEVDKETILAILQEIAKADGESNPEEKAIMARVKKELGLGWTKEHTLGCGFLLVIIYGVWWAISGIWGWLGG